MDENQWKLRKLMQNSPPGEASVSGAQEAAPQEPYDAGCKAALPLLISATP